MMSSQSTVIDPVFRSKMPLFDGAIASTGLSKPKNMPGFLGKQALQYSGAYFTYDPRAKDGAGFTPDWNNSKTSLLDDRSPVNQLSGMEGENHIIYRQDGNSAEIGHSHTSPMSHTPIKQGFTPYTKNREISSPTAATVAVRKQKTAENSSPASENLVYLAIPKPVYGHNPCCNEVSCVIGQRYAVEHGSQRIQSTVYEHDWMQTDAHYSERPPIQRKVQDTLLQQRGVQFEHGAERLKRMTVETYSQSRARTLPAVIEPNYSSYPCTPTHTHFGSLNEQSQHLQTPSRGYPSLYSSHPTYEHMTSELYRERSHMSKYGQLTQHPMFYYPQANVEVEKRTQCKDIGGKQREDVPVILKHTMSSPRDHYAVPQSLRSEIPLHLPSTETMSSHSFIQGYDYPCYAVPRFNLNASQIRAPLKRQHASPSWHFNRINVSSSGQHGDHPVASVAKDKPDTSLHVDQSHTSSPFLLVDQTSPIRCVGQPGVSPPSIQMNRFFPSLTSQHIDRPILAPAGLNMDRLLDCSCEAQVMCPKQPKDHSVSPVSWLPQSPNHSSDRIPTAVTNGANVRKMIYSPAAATGNKHNGPTSSSATSVHKGSLKRSVSHSSPPMKIKEEDQDLYEVDLIKKRQKMEMENVQVRNKTNSPPMPIIDNVFSLAPYQPYLQASGVLFSGGVHPRTVQSSEHCEVKPKPFIKEKKPDRDQQPVVRAASKNICPDTPTERPVVDLFETQNIKVEKIDPPDTDNSVESSVGQKDCSKITIKEEPEDTDLNDDGLMLVIKKCESDELENKPSLTDGNETSDESKPVEVTAQITTPSQGDTSTPHDQVVSPHSKPIVTSQPPETKLNFKNIPRQCLKLSAYKIILPDMNSCAVPPQEKPPVEPTAEIIPKLELQMPVRKHFSELHHSLCKLVSKSVSASSEQKLRTWLSQLELTQPASPLTKVQKVSCLLGIKAREVWLNEEMKSALHKVLERLREYTAQERCPFPHVMRTGAVFVPMLVVKELLFSMVQGTFIDQVLQEHKVELRPTTLSEEKILIQLHKRACSSRLRKLMSLKHLPDIYADVLNLLYYTSVCKHLGLEMGDCVNRQQDGCEESNESPDITASPASPSPAHPQRHLQDDETKLHLSRNRTKSRVKSSSRRLFLDSSLSDKEEADDSEKTESGGGLNTSSKKNTSGHQCEEAENEGNDRLVAEEDSCENSWMCPLTYDDLLQSSGDTAIETPSSLDPVCHSSGQVEFQLASQSCSGVILKLRRMFSEGLNRKKACYQAVSDSFTDPSLSQEEDVEGKRNSEGDFHTRTPKVNHRWQRTGSLSRTLRPLGSSSKRKHRSLLKIKYCPYLSACHSAEHRRRWVLRSAVQRARRDMRFYYPDLVGKRIRHLYEEDDKSEVWYRGEVLRIHEAHTNPLKTIFEVRYDSEPEWKYYLELLIDYKKGWLKIED